MDRWTQRILAAAAMIFALSVATATLAMFANRPETTRYQLINPQDWHGSGLFNSRTGEVYNIKSSTDPNMNHWVPFLVVPPDIGSKRD